VNTLTVTRLGGARVLIVDDDPAILNGLNAAFGRAGSLTQTAGNGDEALRRIDTFMPNLLVTDIIMPDREGLETIMASRARNPELKIIAISGGGRIDSGEFLSTARALGADAILRKPFRPSQLLAMADQLLGPDDGGR